MTLPNCPQCESEYTYEDRALFICPECGHEWNALSMTENELVVKDMNGTRLVSGDNIIVMKDLNVKGAPRPLKQGTKVKNIRIVDADHNIDCRIEGFGAMSLKSEFVKKS